ncbi:MAG: transposase [Desulfosalsimonas sp.]
MMILYDILTKLKHEFSDSRKGEERGTWFIYTLVAIIAPFASSKTSNLLRCIETVFGLSIRKKRYYGFMASPKMPWNRLWHRLWGMIPEPLTKGRLIIAIDDYINPKTGRKIFACDNVFDHAAKMNQSKYPWAQNIVTIGLLKVIKGRWACLPLSYRFYHLQKNIEKVNQRLGKNKVEFETKMAQAVAMITEVAHHMNAPVLAVADSWFGNNGLWNPLRKQLGERFHILSRLRSNQNLFDNPAVPEKIRPGRPLKYGKKLGNTALLANTFRELACEYSINLYGREQTILAYERVVMLKTLKVAVRVVWVFRKTQWVALFSTDLSLSVEQIIEYYGARWKIEAAFKELKQDIGSLETQTRHPQAVTNHLHFCMTAMTVSWIYASRLEKTPERRHAVSGRRHFAFSDVRRSVAQAALGDNFVRLFPVAQKSILNSAITALMRMAA